jgi:hypothetical protein
LKIPGKGRGAVIEVGVRIISHGIELLARTPPNFFSSPYVSLAFTFL